jgi:hypothetical protein
VIPWTWTAGAVGAALLVGAAAGWSLRADKCRADLAALREAAATQAAALRHELDTKSADYEALRAKANVTTERRTNTVREIYRHVTVPALCEPPADAVGVLDAAVSAANAAAAGEPRGYVRGSAGVAEPARRP